MTLEVPTSWATAELKDIIEVKGGSQPAKAHFSDVPKPGYVRLVQIRDFRTDAHKVYIPEELSKRSFTKDDIMIGRYGPPVFQILRGLEGSYNVALMKATPARNISRDYIYWLLKSPKVQNDVIAVSQRSAGQSGVNLDFLNKYRLPLPPVGEQQRIVDKIEICFEKVDTTESGLEKAKTLMGKYKEALLAKAFRGELVPQDPADEPANQLIERIRIEREQADAGKKRKKKSEFAPVTDADKPYDIPDSWDWVRLGELASDADYAFVDGPFGSNLNSKHYTKSGVPVLHSGTVARGYYRSLEQKHFVNAATFEDLKRSAVKGGDIVIAKIGANYGGSAILPEDFGMGLLSGNTMKITPSKKLILTEYLWRYLWLLKTTAGFENYVKKTAQPALSLGGVKKIPVPLPPLAEQRRIISKIEILGESQHAVATLLEQLATSVEYIRSSILDHAFKGELVDQLDAEGTGHQLLEEILEEKAKLEADKPKKKTKKKSRKKKS